jgi:hypothetical protein
MPCITRPLAKQAATRRKTTRALRTLPRIAPIEPSSIVNGVKPSSASIITAAAITVASIELRPCSAQ